MVCTSQLRSLFKLGALCLIFHYFEYPENKTFWEIKIICAINQFQTIQSLHWLKK